MILCSQVIRRGLHEGGTFRPRIRNRNPLNLERLGIGYRPEGFMLNKESVSFWNRLFLEISQKHTTAHVTHWTGRPVARASTTEWAVRKHLYNNTDAAALRLIGSVIGLRALETGVIEVNVQIPEEDLKKERMRMFMEAIKNTGLITKEPPVYEQFNPFRQLSVATTRPKYNFKPWNIIDE